MLIAYITLAILHPDIRPVNLRQDTCLNLATDKYIIARNIIACNKKVLISSNNSKQLLYVNMQ